MITQEEIAAALKVADKYTHAVFWPLAQDPELTKGEILLLQMMTQEEIVAARPLGTVPEVLNALQVLAAAWRSLDGSFIVVEPNQAGPALRIEFSLPKSGVQHNPDGTRSV